MMPHSRYGRHFLITGLVQGVGFRLSAQHEARRLGLTGWVRNLADGRVEAEAFGTSVALDRLQQWLRRGPAMARVAHVTARSITVPDDLGKGFILKPTHSGPPA